MLHKINPFIRDKKSIRWVHISYDKYLLKVKNMSQNLEIFLTPSMLLSLKNRCLIYNFIHGYKKFTNHHFSMSLSLLPLSNLHHPEIVYLHSAILEAWWLRWQGRRLRTEKTWVQFPAKAKQKLFSVGCFGAYEISLLVFAVLLQIHVIIVTETCKMSASPCYFPGHRWMKNIHASTSPFTDVYGPLLHEGTSKHEDLLKVSL